MRTHRYAVIMAGGKGTRFWPLSRSRRPKQLLKIWSEKSLMRETVDRILPLFEPEEIVVVTVQEHQGAMRKELGLLPKKNFLIEPQGKNTAPCIGLAAIELVARDPDAIMIVLPADHWVSDAASFRRRIDAAAALAEERDALVTIGIRPGHPETGYGYILKGGKIKGDRRAPAYRVRDFREKPSREQAARWIRLGALWNGGIFIWRAATILKLLERFAPPIAEGLRRIGRATRGAGLGTLSPRLSAALRREYRKMPNTSIDYAVLEKAGSEGLVLTLEADFDWSDVGNWDAVHRLLPRDRDGNAGLGRRLALDSKDCLVYSADRLVAVLGMENTVVVDTPDALLVGDIRRSQDVRALVEELNRKGFRRYTVR